MLTPPFPFTHYLHSVCELEWLLYDGREHPLQGMMSGETLPWVKDILGFQLFLKNLPLSCKIILHCFKTIRHVIRHI